MTIGARHPLLVFIDSVSVANVVRIAAAAGERGIATALICPRGAWPERDERVAIVTETDDFSLPAIRRILRKLDARFEIRGVHSSFGPFRPEAFVHGVVATIAAERGLSYSPVEAMIAATNKCVARMRFAAAGVPDIRFGVASDARSLRHAARTVGYPLILKPLTGVGSSLIFKCRDENEAQRSLRRALRALPRAHYEQLRMAPHDVIGPDGETIRFDPVRSMLVEQYLDGREASVECLVAGGKVTPLLVHDKLEVEETEGVVLEHLLIVPPTRFTPAEVRLMKAHAARAVEALELRDMFCHVELRWVDGVGPRILEVNPRVGAASVTDSIERFTTLDVDATRVRLILGERPRPFRRRRAARHAMMFLFSPRNGRLVELSGAHDIVSWPGVDSVRIGYKEGDLVGGDSEEIFLVSIFMRAADERAARRAYARVRRTVRIRVG